MQSAEEFARRLRYREIEEQWDGENETYVDVGFGLSDQDAIDEVAARDAEWQARVDRATDEAVSQALKVVQASEDYRKLQARVDELEAALDYAIACLPGAPLNAKEKLRTALGREA